MIGNHLAGCHFRGLIQNVKQNTCQNKYFIVLPRRATATGFLRDCHCNEAEKMGIVNSMILEKDIKDSKFPTTLIPT